MPPRSHLSLAAILLAGSITMEITLLAGIFHLGDGAYHTLHILLMATLVASQFAVYLHGRRTGAANNLALWFAAGAAFTMIGDYVNGAISGVEPVSLKLTWALLLFGIGYSLYCIALWRHNNAVLNANPGTFSRLRYLVAVPILAVNVVSWFQHVEPHVGMSGLLYYGSFVFNATIYVMLPTFALWFYVNSGRSVGGLLVLAGAVLIPYSDLVLFASWLRGGDPAVPAFELYAYNWILYFGGQVLVSLYPSRVMAAAQRQASAD